jgi:hypothetical protein
LSEEQDIKPESELKQVEEIRQVERNFGKFFSFKLKGDTKEATLENYSILFIIIGAVILSAGIGLTAVSSVGIPVIMAMAGAFISFVSIVVLIVAWLVQEWKRG